jgi:hypothetical protein
MSILELIYCSLVMPAQAGMAKKWSVERRSERNVSDSARVLA